MAKRKRARADEKTEAAGQAMGHAAAADKPKRGRKKRDKTAAEQKPPADPFGEVLPGYEELGSPADGNWKPTGLAERDLATLESQERFLFRLMMLRKAEM